VNRAVARICFRGGSPHPIPPFPPLPFLPLLSLALLFLPLPSFHSPPLYDGGSGYNPWKTFLKLEMHLDHL
jgi:hypothetical protein